MKKYLVIGNPIEHSLSPKLHNYWFEKNNIEYLDCNQENLGEKYIVKDEGHPNEKLHSIWSDCIFEYLKVN